MDSFKGLATSKKMNITFTYNNYVPDFKQSASSSFLDHVNIFQSCFKFEMINSIL